MTEWIECTLSDLVSFQRGYDLPKSHMQKGQYPVVGSNGIIGFHNEYTTDEPSITIGRSGNVGKPFIYYGKTWSHNTTLYVKDYKGNDPVFVFYFLKTMDLANYGGGSAVPTLNRNHIHTLSICVPKNIEQQKKIGVILATIDHKILINNAINDNLEQQAQAIFKAWFVDFEPFGGVMPDDWKIGNLEDVIKFYNGYAFKSKELLNKQKKSCYAVFKQGHIKSGGGFIPTGTKSWFPKKKSENLQKYILCKGDILMAMTDMKDNVAILGNTAVMAVDNQYLLNQRVGLLRCNGKYEISYPYIYLLTNSKDFLQDLRSRANSGVQVNLSSAAIKESSIIIPSRSTNIKFNQIVKPMFEITFKNNMEIDRLSSLRDTLLPKLMSGEIDVSNIEI